jgi:hypothetical protein
MERTRLNMHEIKSGVLEDLGKAFKGESKEVEIANNAASCRKPNREGLNRPS